MTYRPLKSLLAATALLVVSVFMMPVLADDKDAATRINREEIQAAVMSFSDTWAAVIYEAALQLKKTSAHQQPVFTQIDSGFTTRQQASILQPVT